MEKGQFSYEFLGTAGVAVLIYGIFVLYITTSFAGLLPFDNQNYEAGFYAKRVADAISAAQLAGDGYFGSFELPEQIEGHNYTVHYGNSSIEIDIIGDENTSSYGVAEFFGDAVLSNVGGGTNYVTNSNRTVIVWRRI